MFLISDPFAIFRTRLGTNLLNTAKTVKIQRYHKCYIPSLQATATEVSATDLLCIMT